MDKADFIWVVLIISLALAFRIVWVLVFRAEPYNDAADYDGLARRIASGDGYVAPDGAHTAYRPVGYPAFLEVLYLLFGHLWLIGGVANALLGTLSVALTYGLAREFLPSRLSAVVAGIIALLPSHIMSYTSALLTKALYTVHLLTVLIVTRHLVRHTTWKNAALLGWVIGLGVYVRAILILFPLRAGI